MSEMAGYITYNETDCGEKYIGNNGLVRRAGTAAPNPRPAYRAPARGRTKPLHGRLTFGSNARKVHDLIQAARRSPGGAEPEGFDRRVRVGPGRPGSAGDAVRLHVSRLSPGRPG